jgi:hypothetical protein
VYISWEERERGRVSPYPSIDLPIPILSAFMRAFMEKADLGLGLGGFKKHG